MDPAERAFVLRHLGESRERLIQAVEGLSPEQRGFRPAEDRWSIADCVEHITVLEWILFERVLESLQKPPESGLETDVLKKDGLVLGRVPTREIRVKAPGIVMPTGRWPEFEELMRQFEATREQTLRFAKVTEADLRGRSLPHPFLGPLDCYQWLLFFAAHCERHVRQMEEVKSDPGFPRGQGTSA